MRCCEGQRSTAYLHSTSFLRMRERLNGSFHAAGAKEPSAEGKERLQKELTQTHAGDQLADTYSQHEQRNAAGDVIGVGQDKRDDQRVGYNGRDRAQVRILLSRQPSVRPGIAAGVKKGMIVRASEKRTCMAPLARSNPAAIMVRTV